MLRTASVRVLGLDLHDEVEALLREDPVANSFIASRLAGSRGRPGRLGGDLWGYYEGGVLQSVCFAGANLVPAQPTERASLAFAEHALRRGRRCSTLLGPQDAVRTMWQHLEPTWGPARDERLNQPLLAIRTSPRVAPDPLVRVADPVDLDLVLPASVAMFTEEVGVSPTADGGLAPYRARCAELLNLGRTLARIENGTVVFKADIGVVSADCCQIQGVWIDPQRRGEGLAAPAMAAVVQYALASVAPVVSLYVNDFNHRARAAYRRTGFTEVGSFASVLF